MLFADRTGIERPAFGERAMPTGAQDRGAAAELRVQLRFEELITRVARQLAVSSPDRVEDAVRESLRLIAEFFSADRVVFESITPDGEYTDPRYKWTSSRVDPALDVLPETTLPAIKAAILERRQLHFGNVEDIPREWAEENDYLSQTDIRSGFATPVYASGDPVGFLVVEYWFERREWPRAVLARAELAGEIVAGAIAHRQARQTILLKQQQLERSLAETRELQARLEAETVYLRQEIRERQNLSHIVGESFAIRAVLHQIEEVAPADTTVVVEGETGVGKELVARAIHDESRRAAAPFITVSCAALPAELIESELFGHEAGAFTGARGLRRGRFELADGGTLFLDEVGELPLELQGKLLRVLEQGELERVGGTETLKLDVRILAATHRDLRADVEAGRFREDLFYRLYVYPVTVPPLRQRRGDVPLLVESFVPRIAARIGKAVAEVPAEVLRMLCGYDWPGNVRELKNVIERAVVISHDGVLRLPEPLTVSRAPEPASAAAKPAIDHTLEELERRHILSVLETTGWRVSGPQGAAKILGLNPSTLRSRMKKLGLERSVAAR